MREWEKKGKGKPFKWSTTIFHFVSISKCVSFHWDEGSASKKKGALVCSIYVCGWLHEPIFRSISEQYEMRAKCELHPNCNIIRANNTSWESYNTHTFNAYTINMHTAGWFCTIVRYIKIYKRTHLFIVIYSRQRIKAKRRRKKNVWTNTVWERNEIEKKKLK